MRLKMIYAVEIFESHVNGYTATQSSNWKSNWDLEITLVREAFDDLEICFDEQHFVVEPKKVKLYLVSEADYIKLFLWKKITDTSLYQWYQTDVNRLNYLRRFLRLSLSRDVFYYWFESTRTPTYPYAADALALLLKFNKNDLEHDF
jgi:hypothetical protein